MSGDDIVIDPNPRPQCDHICLQVEGHDGPHFYGYLFPSPVREIERLQAEIERLRAMCNDLHHDATCTESWCRLCGEGVREWEARRG